MSSNELLTKLYEARQAYVKQNNSAKITECDTYIAKLKAKIHLELSNVDEEHDNDLTRVNDKFLTEETFVDDDIASLKARQNELMAELEKINLKLKTLGGGGSDYANDPALLGGKVVNGKFVEDDDSGEGSDNLSVYLKRRQDAINSGHYNADSSFVKVTNIKQNANF